MKTTKPSNGAEGLSHTEIDTAAPPAPNLSPIRIYILWHPGLDLPGDLKGRDKSTFSAAEMARIDRGLKLARRIYHWFRMENMEGIPVYFRSTARQGAGELPDLVEPETGVRNYVIPLVEENMVASPEWRRYVAALARRDDDASKNHEEVSEEKDCRLFPVAMDSVAYNMPEGLRQMNFIRHVQDIGSPPDDSELLAKLTEVLCRDIRYWLLRDPKLKSPGSIPAVPGKIRIFLSHAKADDTNEAQTIKEYIQRNTQCEAFFDETDIASGYNYKDVLKNAVTHESAGLIVIQGDNYADRPWCRKEIRDFLSPVKDPLAGARDPLSQFFIPPVVVVQTMKGIQLARTIPELGYSPCLRWQEKSAGFVVTTLLREILFGLFYRVLADRTAQISAEFGEVFINRAPDPVMVNRILKARQASGPCPSLTIVHPGYGLSRLEKEGLECASNGVGFRSFLDHARSAPNLQSAAIAESVPPASTTRLSGKVIVLSAGTSGDILATGQSDEHISELLTRLLRPFIASGASVIYGGRLPKTFRPDKPWNDSLNFTALVMSLLLSERETSGTEASNAFPRLILTVPWHARARISTRDVAQWLDICSILLPPDQEIGIVSEELLPEPTEPTPEQMEDAGDPAKRKLRDQYRERLKDYENLQSAVKAVSLSAMRRRISAGTLDVHLPDAPAGDKIAVVTVAHILIGGATSGFSGIMPGLFEEALYALQSRKPVFIIGACGGAASFLANWLLELANPSSTKPRTPAPSEFTARHYEKQESFSRMLQGIKHRAITCNPNDTFSDLWSKLCEVHDEDSLAGLLNNGLNGAENVALLKTTSFLAISDSIGKGIVRRLEPEIPADGNAHSP